MPFKGLKILSETITGISTAARAGVVVVPRASFQHFCRDTAGVWEPTADQPLSHWPEMSHGLSQPNCRVRVLVITSMRLSSPTECVTAARVRTLHFELSWILCLAATAVRSSEESCNPDGSLSELGANQKALARLARGMSGSCWSARIKYGQYHLMLGPSANLQLLSSVSTWHSKPTPPLYRLAPDQLLP